MLRSLVRLLDHTTLEPTKNQPSTRTPYVPVGKEGKDGRTERLYGDPTKGSAIRSGWGGEIGVLRTPLTSRPTRSRGGVFWDPPGRTTSTRREDLRLPSGVYPGGARTPSPLAWGPLTRLRGKLSDTCVSAGVACPVGASVW